MNTGNDSAKKISQRIVWLDIAKALGIVAIVLGHTIQGGLVKKYVYSFHVPMFFFLQGITFSVTKMEKRPFPAYLKHRAKSMLIPYYFFAVISTLAVLAASVFITPPAEANISPSIQLFSEILFGYCDANRPLWFIPCSFCVAVFGYGIVSMVNKLCVSQKNRCRLLMIVALLGCLALYVNDTYLHIYNLFWKADTAIQMLPFFIAGYIVMEFNVLEQIFALPKGEKICLCVASIVCGGALGIWNDEAGYLGNYYGYISIFYCSALISILGYLLAAKLLPPFNVFTYIGRSTLSILLMHKFPLLVFQYLIPFTKKLLQQRSLAIGICVSLLAIAFCCSVQELFNHICPVLIGRSKTERR